MIVTESLHHWRDYVTEQRRLRRTLGLVPTMGALHAGHVSLIERAASECDEVIVTIFVNARQFNDPRDLEAYPRTLEADLALCMAAGASIVVTPSSEEMWPHGVTTTVNVAGISESLEGAGRPGHFDGVASVVTKLFAISGPAKAYFGEKDFQQVAVVRRLNDDLGLGMDIVACPVIRDHDGLALSSRNVRLSDEGRTRALAISRALFSAAARPAPSTVLIDEARHTLSEAGCDIAYVAIVDPLTFEPTVQSGPARLLIAALVEGVRLIDNASVELVEEK